MTARLLGAACVLVGAAGAGFLRAAHWAGEAALLASFCQALARMAGEIRCNQTRLPPLCRQLVRELTGPARTIFLEVAQGLEAGARPAEELWDAALGRHGCPAAARQIWHDLALTFGRYDPARQADAIDAALAQMQLLARQAASARAERGRQCRVFGICGGAALAILLL